MNTETNLQSQEESLFLEQDFQTYDYASTGQRFLNFIIDNLVMRFGVTNLSGYVVGFLLQSFFPDYLDLLAERGGLFYLTILLIVIINQLSYYAFCEKVFKGYTLGKLITGTRAIREDGGELTWKNAFLRSLSRLVPFEPFSAWAGNGLWHDSWTKTMVIRTR